MSNTEPGLPYAQPLDTILPLLEEKEKTQTHEPGNGFQITYINYLTCYSDGNEEFQEV